MKEHDHPATEMVTLFAAEAAAEGALIAEAKRIVDAAL